MDAPDASAPGASAPAEARYIGQERVPLLVAEARALGADAMAKLAPGRPFAADGPHYPGVRSPAPEGYGRMIVQALTGPVSEMMGWTDAAFEVIATDFSLVTTPPRALTPIQRIPHFDGTDPDVIAVLHYLCGPEGGGTAFFRHRVTGFERITSERAARYDEVLRADVRTHGLPEAAYVDGSTPLFEETERVGARFGRLLAYPGNALHSGRIPAGAALPDDPATGRLTVNTFLRRVA